MRREGLVAKARSVSALHACILPPAIWELGDWTEYSGGRGGKSRFTVVCVESNKITNK